MFNQSAIQAAAWNQQHPQKPMTSGVLKDSFTAVKNDVANVASPIIRSMPEGMQNTGDNVAMIGYGLTLTGAGAEIGVPLAGAGNAISLVGDLLQIGIDFYDGKYSEGTSGVAKTLLIEAGQRQINKRIDKIPGSSKVKKEVLRQTVDMTIKAADNIATPSSEKQKKK